MDSNDFNVASALIAAQALQRVLARRTHRKKYMGQVLLLPGQLGEALRLPSMITRLQSRQAPQRQSGLEAFVALWQTLSEPTRQHTREEAGWYDPASLDWEDKRSNRRASFPADD